MAKYRLFKIIKSGSAIFGIYLLCHFLFLNFNSSHLQNTDSDTEMDQLGEIFIHRKLKHHLQFNYARTIPPHTNINVYNLSTTVPSDVEAFECVQSATAAQFSICIYDPQIDKFISNYLKNGGIWEPSITAMFSKALDFYPNAVTVDIGANIGYYSFLSCAKDHEVIAIEPVYQSLVRFHKGAKLNHCQKQITLLQNALYSDHRLVTMTTNKNNQGGVWISGREDGIRETRGQRQIMTTTLDDLLFVRPLSQAILKVDIEGFECKVFERSLRFLELVHVPYIFMEWRKMYVNNGQPSSPCPTKAVLDMTDTLLAQGYTAFELHTGFKLDLSHRDGKIWRIDDTYWQHYSAPDLKPAY